VKDAEIDHLFLAAKQAARAGGAELLARFGRLKTNAISQKGHADYVSEADTTAEAAILEVLNGAAPGYGFLGEETGYHAGEKPRLGLSIHWTGRAILSGAFRILPSASRCATKAVKCLEWFLIPFETRCFPPFGEGVHGSTMSAFRRFRQSHRKARWCRFQCPFRGNCNASQRPVPGRIANDHGKSCRRPSPWLGRS
jgi:3'-phosphoadenosine 5'-phosphosulfate (PAPS) 3'-phosphatase